LEEFKLSVSLKAEPLFCLGGKKTSISSCSPDTFFIVTNSTLATILFATIVVFLFWFGARKAKLIPGRLQAFLELIIETLYNLVENSTSRKVARVIFPLVATYFIWILFANWFSLLPGVGSVGFIHEVTDDSGKKLQELVPLFRGPNADLNMTFAMAILAIIIVQVAAIAAHGVKGWLKEFAPEPIWMDWLLTPLEIIGVFTRILSLAFRLFGNIFAGEVLLAVMLKLFAPAVVVFYGLELFVGFVQALVFALLTLTYLAMVTGGGHNEEEHHEDEHNKEVVTSGEAGQLAA